MRAEILAWSTISGAVLGLLAGAGALALGIVVAAMLPAPWSRALQAWLPLALFLTLGALPLAGAVLGFLEGRLKLR